jgi:hypothetical protein
MRKKRKATRKARGKPTRKARSKKGSRSSRRMNMNKR